MKATTKPERPMSKKERIFARVLGISQLVSVSPILMVVPWAAWFESWRHFLFFVVLLGHYPVAFYILGQSFVHPTTLDGKNG